MDRREFLATTAADAAHGSIPEPTSASLSSPAPPPVEPEPVPMPSQSVVDVVTSNGLVATLLCHQLPPEHYCVRPFISSRSFGDFLKARGAVALDCEFSPDSYMEHFEREPPDAIVANWGPDGRWGGELARLLEDFPMQAAKLFICSGRVEDYYEQIRQCKRVHQILPYDFRTWLPLINQEMGYGDKGRHLIYLNGQLVDVNDLLSDHLVGGDF